MYKYETHLHTAPVSRCASASVKETLEFYKSKGYDGVFLTNHFLDGNINIDYDLPYEEKINFYFSDYEEALSLADEIGIKVFLGVELSYKGTDFLVYGLDKQWYLEHPEIMNMKKSKELDFLRENGALVIQAHPYRTASYIDHIRLFPLNVDGFEVINASRTEEDNIRAKYYAQSYNLLEIAGSDNHCGKDIKKLAGVCSEKPIFSEQEFLQAFREGKFKLFSDENE